ncbi:cytochrome P450 [Streptomonospora salina]|uniref:Cytochrome P450 n=1 Tax=Streptomonospora salina TaxID=104205 RepID=A0A841ED56_9ACTN|nr:cytochrome P450 [Streptomonospora salina]
MTNDPASSEPARQPAPAPALTGYPDHDQAVRFFGPDIAVDPATLYHDMRWRYGPVAPILLDHEIPAWFVMGYREVHYVTSNPQWFARDCRRWNMWDHIPDDWPLMPYVGWTPSVMFAEANEHQRRAGALGDALDEVDRTELALICQRVADELIDGFSGDGQAELVAQYAHQIPARVVAELFGLPLADVPGLVNDILDSLDVTGNAAEAHGRVQERMQRLVADSHARPGQDVPTRLIEHSAGLTDDEIVIDLLVVMSAAQAPTGNWIANTLRHMFVDDRFSVSLQGGRSSAVQALNEVLWRDTPTQNFIGRWAAQACELGGRRINRGDLLVLGLAAANADPRVQPEEQLDSGANRAHMSFGHGEHGCPFPAPELAEVIARNAVEVLLDRLPDIELDVPEEKLEWRPSVWMRGLYTLPVHFTPAIPMDERTP